ncbi:hypothetical protein AUJ15_00515 [Candidatus Micrarchaeota archaeon CG1_02_55_41]|nr:MAG: hypothetical protein AUJ15_00515 [Candidatus Micrarchaeota archaeon CG1_02_55_41]
MQKTCPKCGRKGVFNGAFCAECEPTLQNQFRTRKKKGKPLQVCTRCKKVRAGKDWVNNAWPEKVEKTICPECSLQSGGYHEAIIQIRGPAEKAVALARKAVKEISGKTHVTDVKESRHGADVFVVRKRPAIEFVHSLGMEFKQTRKLVTQTRDGKRVYRTTLCVRLE